ncbi:Uncharacterised protein [Nocardia brasiliensis]|nr:Uncharacterised protein [Nocardia brasiliensis]
MLSELIADNRGPVLPLDPTYRQSIRTRHRRTAPKTEAPGTLDWSAPAAVRGTPKGQNDFRRIPGRVCQRDSGTEQPGQVEGCGIEAGKLPLDIRMRRRWPASIFWAVGKTRTWNSVTWPGTRGAARSRCSDGQRRRQCRRRFATTDPRRVPHWAVSDPSVSRRTVPSGATSSTATSNAVAGPVRRPRKHHGEGPFRGLVGHRVQRIPDRGMQLDAVAHAHVLHDVVAGFAAISATRRPCRYSPVRSPGRTRSSIWRGR